MVLTTSKLVAHVSLANGAVSFTDPAGKKLLTEEVSEGWPAAGVSRRFNAGTDEAFYGSGQHQNAQLNLNGEDVELSQHNMDIARAVHRLGAQLRRALGQQRHLAHRRPQALWPGLARSQDPAT